MFARMENLFDQILQHSLSDSHSRDEDFADTGLLDDSIQYHCRGRDHVGAVRPESQLSDSFLDAHGLQPPANRLQLLRSDSCRTVLLEQGAPDFTDGLDASPGPHTQMNSLHPEFVLKALLADIDVLGNQVIESGR